MFKPPPNLTAPSSSTKPAATEDPSKAKPTDAPAELSAVVDDLLDSLSKKFATVSEEIFEKMDAMSSRLDEMEKALNNGSATAK